MLRLPKEEPMALTTEAVNTVIDDIRPHLQADGGDIALVDITDEGIVRVRLLGACAGCPGAMMTLKMGVERILKEKLEGVHSVEAVPF